MALPPWTVELLRRGVADFARQVTDNETATSLKEHATKLVDELPKAAREKVDSILRQAEATTRPLKDVWQSGVLWGGGGHTLTPTRLINGTGRLLDPRGPGVGLPAEVLAAALPFLSGDGSRVDNASQRFCEEIATAISQRVNEGASESRSLSAVVTNSLDASLALIAMLGRRGGCLHVPRCCAVSMTASTAPTPAGDDLLVDRLRRYRKGQVREFGRIDGSDRWAPEYFASRTGEPHDRHSPRTQRHTLVRFATKNEGNPVPQSQREDWIDVAVLPIGTLFSAGEKLAADSLVENLQLGADVVVLGGGVLAGTPELSLIVGSTPIIERLRDTPRYTIVSAATAMTAMVASSVKVQANGASPVVQLASVSEENLQDRAQRLATQLAGCDGVESTRVTQKTATLGLPEPPSHTADAIPSRQVVMVMSANHDAAALAHRLAEGSHGLLCQVSGSELSIDLRWITPEQQSQIGVLVAQAI